MLVCIKLLIKIVINRTAVLRILSFVEMSRVYINFKFVDVLILLEHFLNVCRFLLLHS